MIADATLERVLPRRSVALWGDVIRAVLWGAVVLAWLIFAPIYGRMLQLTAAGDGRNDFTIFYYTARLVADGAGMYGASPARYGVRWAADHLGNLNPPHVVLLFQPLAWFPFDRAFTLWCLANVAAFAIACSVVMRASGLRITWKRLAIGGAVILSAAPFTTVAITSELTFLLLVPFTLAWAAARRGRWGAAGALLGLCIAWKLFLLLFVPWLVLTRRWRALAWAAATAGACVAAGTAAYGVDAYRQWLQSLGTVGWWWLPLNASWQGLVSRLLEGSKTVAPALHAPALVLPLSSVGNATLIVASLVWAIRAGRRGRGLDTEWLILLVGALLASPLGWVYYLPLALGPVVGLLATGEYARLSGRWVAAGAVAAIGLYVPLEQASSGQPSALATLTLASSYFWGTAVPWLALSVGDRVRVP